MQPAQGTPGVGNQWNWDFYYLPGQLVQNGDGVTTPGEVIGQPYDIAYANKT